MAKEDNLYIRKLLIKRLKYYLKYSELNIYLKFHQNGEVFKFILCLEEEEIKAVFQKEALEYFGKINEKDILSYSFSNDSRSYKNQFKIAYNSILSSLETDIKKPIKLQYICLVFGAYYKTKSTNSKPKKNTLTYNAYKMFHFKVKELRPLGNIFERKLNKYYDEDLIEIKEIGDIMHEKWRNVIYFGPPGTGKSTEIENVAKNLLKINDEEKIVRVTFNPEYSYYDFIGQYKPVVGTELAKNEINLYNGKKSDKKPFVYYDFVPGAFTSAIIKALKIEESKDNVLLIVEELNRGNCSAIFGDFFQLLDRNEQGESLYGIEIPFEMKNYIISKCGWNEDGWNKKYKGGFKIPLNLYIYASMNTSDESIFPIDSAFRRRWYMRYVEIVYDNKDLDNRYLPKPLEKIKWSKFLKCINSRIIIELRNEDKQLGQWFINNEETSDEEVFIEKVLSYLWFSVVDKDHNSIFNQSISSFQELHKTAYENGIDKIFSEEFIESLKDN